MSGKRIFKNAIYLFISNVGIRLLSATTTILIARTLGASDYGILSVALAFASVAGYFTDLGLTHTLTREATKKDANLSILMSSYFRIRILFALLTCLISIIVFETFYPNPYFQKVLYWVVMPTIIGAALQGVGAGYYQVIEKMHFTAIIRTIAGLTTSLGLLAGIIFKWPLLLVGPVYGFANVLAGIVSVIIVTKSITITKGWDRSILVGLGSFTLSGISILLIPQLGPIILEKVSTVREVGYFSAAYRIPVVLYQIPSLIAVAFYPILFRLGNENKIEEHFKLNTVQLKVMSFIGIIMALPFLLFSEWWITILFGSEWLKAAPILTVLSLYIIIQSIYYPIADALITTGYQNRRTIILLTGAVISVLLYLVLVKRYGSYGGGIAAVATELLLLVGFTLAYPRGLSLLIKGFIRNAGTLIITTLIGYFLFTKIHPFWGNGLTVLSFVTLSLLFDKELRQKVFQLIQNKILRKNKKQLA